jgi:RNA 3'-terminal phosphate cyclase (ATP)
MGPTLTAELHQPGFYPAGGGKVTLRVEPAARLGPLELLERGELVARRVRSLVARLPRHIARRECAFIRRKTGWDDDGFHVEEVRNSRGPGNVVLIELEYEHVTEVFTGFGERGVRAEQVAGAALDAAQRYMRAEVPVGIHLADQLMLPLAVSAHCHDGGGRYRTLQLSRHSTTHLDILGRFLDLDIRLKDTSGDDVLVEIRRRRKQER